MNLIILPNSDNTVNLSITYKEQKKECILPLQFNSFSEDNFEWVLDLILICEDIESDVSLHYFILYYIVNPLHAKGYSCLAYEILYQLGVYDSIEPSPNFFDAKLTEEG